MKKSSLALLAFVTLGFSAPAQPVNINGHNLSLGASIGLLAGQGEEIVYRDTGSEDKLSQLLWEMKPLFYAGLDINYNWLKPENRWGIFAGALFKFGFPDETGVMEDRDWIALYYPGFLTHYSVHDNKTESAVLIDANMGVSFRIFNKFLLKTYVAYNFMHFSWTANGGSVLHPYWDIDGDGQVDGDHGYLNSIDVVTYEQFWHVMSPGIAFYGEFNRYFDIEISIKLSPRIWFSAQDYHILRNLIITENADGGFFIEPGLLFSFKPNKFLTLTAVVAYRNISGTRGDGEYKYKGQPAMAANDMTGAGYSGFDVGITAKFNIKK
jgi:outer membrane protease